MIAYYPLEELDPPKPQQKSVGKSEKTQVGLEESELNYIVIAFIAGVIALAISDVIRA